MNKSLFTIAFLFSSFSTYALDYFWTDSTPNGYFIERFDGGRIEYRNKKNDLIISGSQGGKWYFYKDFTIGFFTQQQNNDESKNCYFISNESSEHFEFFDDEKQWNKRIQLCKAIPKIQTRWYNDSWSFFPIENSVNGFEFFFQILYWIGYSIIFLIGLLVSWLLNHKQIYLKWAKIISRTLFLFFVMYWSVQVLLASFPKSI